MACLYSQGKGNTLGPQATSKAKAHPWFSSSNYIYLMSSQSTLHSLSQLTKGTKHNYHSSGKHFYAGKYNLSAMILLD